MQPTVLVAEPHSATRELLRETLAEAGYRVVLAQDPVQALDLAAVERPAAVLLAVDLPRFEGKSLGALLRGREGGARLPLLAVDKAHLGKARGVGAILDLMVNAYLPDPTRRAEVTAKVAQLVAGAAQATARRGGLEALLAKAPVASGLLKSRSLPELLHASFRLGRDGVLVLAHRDLTRRVFLRAGRPVGFDSTARQDLLGRHLLDRGVLTSAQHDRLLERLRDPKASYASALTDLGVAAAGEPAAALVRGWARDRLAAAYGMSDGRFSFHAGQDFGDLPPLELPALGPIYEGALKGWPARAFATTLAPHLRSYPVRTPAFSADLPELALQTRELKLALDIDGTRPLRQVLEEARDLNRGLALAWFLTLVGALEHRAAPSATGPAPVLREASRPRLKPLPEAQAHALREEAVRVLTGSYFGALGLDVTADGEDVERAFHEAATRFHPDSFPGFELGPVADLLTSVQERLGAAYRVLGDAGKRHAYAEYVVSRADLPRSAPLHVEAEVELKRGERLMRRRDWKGARLAFERAVSLNPREAEYYGYLAWATFEAEPGDRVERAKTALRLVRKALAQSPALDRLQVIAAVLEDEAGDPAQARARLLKVLRANPSLQLAKHALQGLNRRHGAGPAGA